jgi:hypothetical protein
VRRHDADRRCIVLRGSKMLATINVMKHFGVDEKVKNKREILDIFDRCGVEYVIVESEDKLDLKPFKLLRDLLQTDTDRFEKAAVFPVETNMPDFRGMELVVYRVRNPKRPSVDSITIDLPTIGKTITFPLKPRDR